MKWCDRQRAWWIGEATDRPILGINVSLQIHERYPLTMHALPQGEIKPEDAVSLLSPQIYRECIFSVDRRISSEFPAVAYHLHGTTVCARPVARLLAVALGLYPRFFAVSITRFCVALLIVMAFGLPLNTKDTEYAV